MNRVGVAESAFSHALATLKPVPKEAFGAPRRVCVIGSTGSIGRSALRVCQQFPELFQVVGLAAGQNLELLTEQVGEFRPGWVALAKGDRDLVSQRLSGLVDPGQTLLGSIDVFAQLVEQCKPDVVIVAAVGLAPLGALIRAIELGKVIGLANKESVVCAGKLLRQALSGSRATLIPVDSEHSAIFQCLVGSSCSNISKIILTASGGPFLNLPKEDFASVTPAQAVKHPNWSMGKKISIDSATMANKALELIEAVWLFGVPHSQIEVVVHPQSIIHSLVEFSDGSQLAQLSQPDMRGPIAYAMGFPHRLPAPVVPELSLPKLKCMTFAELDNDRFQAVSIARGALDGKAGATAAFHIANEVAVERFCSGSLSFDRIIPIVEQVVSRMLGSDYNCLSDLNAICAQARDLAMSLR